MAGCRRVVRTAGMAAVFGLLLCAAPAAAKLGPPYTDSADGFSIRPPAGWRAIPRPVEHVPVAFVGPVEGDFASTLNVVIVDQPIHMDAGTLAATVRTLEEGHRTPARMSGPGNVQIANYRVTKGSVVKLLGRDAAFIEASYDDVAGKSPAPTRNFQVILPQGNRHFVITYSARASQYDRFLPIIQESVNSFTESPGNAGAVAGKGGGFERRGVLAALAGLGFALALLLGLRMRRRRGAPGAAGESDRSDAP